jgi:hypothetical protein
MIDRKTIAMINEEVDGTNTPEESENLRQILAQNPEAQKLLVDLKKLERNFSSIPSVKPPTNLKRTVMRSIHERQLPASVSTHKFRLADFLFPVRSLPRLGFAFSGGVLAGIALVVVYFAVVSHPSIDDRDATGTILGSSESLQTAVDEPITGDGIEGRVATQYSSTLCVLNVNLTMRPDLVARFVYNPGDAKLKGVALGDAFPGTLTQSNGQLEIGHGGGTFKAFFAPGAIPTQDVRLQIVSAGNLLYDRSIPLGKGQ